MNSATANHHPVVDQNTELQRARQRGREPLAPEVIELTADRLRVIADPTRIAILEVLNEGPAAVRDLSERIGLAHQSASHHLQILHQAGVLSRRRAGKLALYAVADWSAWWVVEQIARSAVTDAESV